MKQYPDKIAVRAMRNSWEYEDALLPPDQGFKQDLFKRRRLRQQIVRRRIARGEYHRALTILDSPILLEVIDAWYECGALDATTLGRCLIAAWNLIEFPHDHGTERLVELFTAAGFLTDTNGVVAPTAPLTVYRGAGHEYRFGLSWTTSIETAQKFARRVRLCYPGTADTVAVYAAEVAPGYVLAMFNGRKESEVVVSPDGLRNLRTLDAESSLG
jgi:hypothetical protein